MASALEWVLKLVDRFSGPANNAAKATENLSAKLRGAQGAATSAENAHKHSAFLFNKNVQEMNKRQSEFNKVNDEGTGGILAAVGGYEALASAAAAASAAVIAVGVGAAVKGSQMAIDASSFRKQSIAAFKVILGTEKAAEDIFDKADELAGKLGLADEQVVGQLKKLTSVGFGADQALSIVKAAADIAVIQGEEAGATFAQLIATMEAKGKFDTRALNQLAKIGVKTEDIFAAVAKKLKITTKEAEALVKAGKVDTKDAVEAILEVVQGRFGTAADSVAGITTRLLFRLKDALEDLFNKVDTTGLDEALDSFITALSGPAGEKIKEGINKIFGGIFDALFGAFDQKRVDGLLNAIGDGLNMLGDVILAMAPAIQALIGGLVDGFVAFANSGVMQAIGSALVKLFTELGKSEAFISAIKIIGQGLAYLVIALGALIGLAFTLISLPFAVFGSALSAIIGVISSIIDAVSGAPDALVAAGENMMAGLANGIIAGTSRVVSAMVNAATSAIGAAKSALGIASPSKVFEGLGSFTSQGFAAGVANDNSGAEAMGSMVEPPSALTAQEAGRSAGAKAGGGGKGSGVTIEQLIVQSATGEPTDIANAVTEALEQMLLATGS